MTLIKSVENVIFNGVNLAERFDSDGGYFVVNHVDGRSYIPTSRDIVTVPNNAGGFAGKLRTAPRIIDIEFTLKARTYEKLRKQIEGLNAVIFGSDNEVSLRFADEMDREYFGRVNVVAETFDESRIHKGTITVVCGDPYKYGMAKTLNGLTVQNNGTVETPFIVEMDVTAPTTQLAISDGKDSLLIGKPSTSGMFEEELIFHDPLDSLNGWSPISGLFTDHTEGGQIVSSIMGTGHYSQYFILANVTTVGQWIGRSIVKSVGTTADYRLETVFEVINNVSAEKGVFRQYVYLIDAYGNEVGRVGMIGGDGFGTNRLEVRIGNENYNYKMIDSSSIYGFFTDVFCKLILEKKGNIFRASVLTVDKLTGVEIKEEITAFYIDVLNQYTTPASATAIHMARQQDHDHRIYDIKLYEYLDEATLSPNVVEAGDKVKIDMGKRLIYINGVLRNSYKNINSDYFMLKTGKNKVAVSPTLTTNHRISFRERFL